MLDGDGGVDEEDALRGARQGGVEPAEEGFVDGIEHQRVQVDVDVFPLAALCLVARHAIGVFHLKGVVVFVFEGGHGLLGELSLFGGEDALV